MSDCIHGTGTNQFPVSLHSIFYTNMLTFQTSTNKHRLNHYFAGIKAADYKDKNMNIDYLFIPYDKNITSQLNCIKN